MRRWVGLALVCVAGCSSTKDYGAESAPACADAAAPDYLSRPDMLKVTSEVECEKFKECYPAWFANKFKEGTAPELSKCQVLLENGPSATGMTSCTAAMADNCAIDLALVECPDGVGSDAGAPGELRSPTSCSCYDH